MPVYIALLRAVNVGGTGKLPMAELKAMCIAEGFLKVQTYIASGNVVFETVLSVQQIRKKLEARLKQYAGKEVGVVVRSQEEMRVVLAGNPFPDRAPNRTMAIFLNEAVSKNALDTIKGQANEEIKLGTREIYVYYGEGMAGSKLKIPAAQAGTARNMNTITKLIALAEKL